MAEFKQVFRLTPQVKSRKKRDYPGELIQQLQFAGLPLPAREVRFDAKRKWRYDLAYNERKIAIEVEGVLPHEIGKTRHQTVAGLSGDIEKYNAGLLQGWRIIRCTPKQIATGQALQWIEAILKHEI